MGQPAASPSTTGSPPGLSHHRPRLKAGAAGESVLEDNKIDAVTMETIKANYRVAWIDSHALSRDCIQRSIFDLKQDLEFHAFAGFEDCLGPAVPRFNLIIMNWHVSYDRCLSALTALRAAFKMALIVVLWSMDEGEQIDKMRQALSAGASGLISTRTTGLAMALTAIRFVQAGGTFVPREILLSEPAPAIVCKPVREDPYQLTIRQSAVMSLLKKGAPNKIIAAELGMSESTVKVHVRSILVKMGATNRTEAVFKARNAI